MGDCVTVEQAGVSRGLDREQLLASAQRYPNSEYGDYIRTLASTTSPDA